MLRAALRVPVCPRVSPGIRQGDTYTVTGHMSQTALLAHRASRSPAGQPPGARALSPHDLFPAAGSPALSWALPWGQGQGGECAWGQRPLATVQQLRAEPLSQ